MKTLQLKKDWYWVGNLDPDLRVFDIIMETEFGTTYNSYVVKGSEKTVLFEASKAKCLDAYLEKLDEVAPIQSVDYLVINHTEPDHTGTVEHLLDLNPALKIVGTPTAINFLKEICNKDFSALPVKDGAELNLGNKTLRFIHAPNLHWPDTMFTYVPEDRVLVSCDAFGAHYSCDGITIDKVSDRAGYEKALRYYFDMIVGPFKPFVLSAIEKIKDLSIESIYTGHGPVLTTSADVQKTIVIYKEWAGAPNPNPKKTVVIPYVSAYGYTAMLADKIAEGIQTAADIEVRKYDLVTDDTTGLANDLYWADGILFGTPTIVGEALKPIWDLTTGMFSRTHGNKFASAFGSFGWSGEGVPNLMQRLRQLKMKVYGDGLKIRFKPNEAQLQTAFEFGYNFGKSVEAGELVPPDAPISQETSWRCVICGEIVKGIKAPAVCPVCGVGPDQFVRAEEDTAEYKSDQELKLLIIGGGAAGVSAAAEARKRNPAAIIDIISEEAVPAYNRPMLTKGLLTDLDNINLYVKPESWYQENRVNLRLNQTVQSIDRSKKQVELADGQTLPYDKLILAVGATSFVPPLPGTELSGVYAIRSLENVRQIKEELPKVDRVVIVGGGLLGLETAWEMKKAGKEVIVVQRETILMNRQLDAKGSALLQKAVEEAGIQMIMGASPEEIEGADGQVRAIRLTDGQSIETRMVIFSTGIKANVGLAAAADLITDRHINVDVKMQTSDPDIYAAGDCAICRGVSYGIWNQALEMGKVAGANAVGDDLSYEEVIPANSFSGMNTAVFSVGDIGRDNQKKYKTLELSDAAKDSYEKLYFFNNRFTGGILMGDVGKAARLLEAFKKQESMEKML